MANTINYAVRIYLVLYLKCSLLYCVSTHDSAYKLPRYIRACFLMTRN